MFQAENIGSDIYMVERGYISITPLQLDQTNFEQVKKLKL